MPALPILLPPGFSPLVNADDEVTAGQEIAENIAKKEEIINIVEELSVSLKKAKKVLVKFPGETVKVGETVAIHKHFLGLRQATIISKVDGVIERYERDSGNLVIKTSYDILTEKIVSPVDGTVALCDNNKIVISTDKNVVEGTQATGTHGEGELFFLKASFPEDEEEFDNKLYHMDGRAIGKIVVGGNLTRELLIKGIGIGVVGLVGMDIDSSDFAYIQEKHASMPVMQIDENALKQLITWKGRKVHLNAESKHIILLQV